MFMMFMMFYSLGIGHEGSNKVHTPIYVHFSKGHGDQHGVYNLKATRKQNWRGQISATHGPTNFGISGGTSSNFGNVKCVNMFVFE